MNTNGEASAGKPEHVPFRYSPERRTALVLCGTGAHGAYHAGVLRALQEAGVKIDVVAGQGIGAGAALLAAIDGSACLWDAEGLWRGPRAAALYRWKWPLRAARWPTLVLVATLLAPPVILALGVMVYAAGFVLEMLGTGFGTVVMSAYTRWLQAAFAGDNLPTIVPRLATVALAALCLALLIGAAVERWRAPATRRAAGSWWWRLAGAPLDADAARDHFIGAVAQLVGSAGADGRRNRAELGRRYADVLAENLGQPGCRELMIVATDLDARRDVVAALLREPYRREFRPGRADDQRASEALDLAGAGGEHAVDVAAAALTPPVVCDPYLLTFAADGHWRGETHRCCDRPGAVSRLLEELAAAGVSQAIIVSAVACSPAPHRLSAPRLDVRHRLGDFLAASEAAALRDAMSMARLRFDSVYLIRPAHNPLGAFDLTGGYDDASDRPQALAELIARGHEDAYRQFIEPVVGASGEQLAHAGVDGRQEGVG